jgi:hypothetical protein
VERKVRCHNTDVLAVDFSTLFGLGSIYRADSEVVMPSTKQRNAARRNIKKAARAARRKRTIAHLPKRTRTALGKQAAKVAQRKRKSSR